jgi:hypothetical protein
VFGKGLGGMSKAERERAVQSIRRLVSKLKRRMAQYRADEHAILIARSCNRQPGYMVLLLANQKYKKGQEPWPGLRRADRDDRLSLKEDRQEHGEPLGVVYWGDRSIRLGENTCLRKLFHYLADQPGRFRAVSEIERFVFGTNCDTSTGVSEEEMNKTQQKLRRLISRLNDRMQEAGLGEEAIIVPHSYQYRPGYFLLLLPEQNSENGRERQPIAQAQSN